MVVKSYRTELFRNLLSNTTVLGIFLNMPKSKRAKVVHLSKVDKKGKEGSLKLYANIQACFDIYQYVIVYSVENMRNTTLKEVRADLKEDSR